MKLVRKKNVKPFDEVYSMKPEQYDVPIALIVFNRPVETKRVFEAIASVQPKNLLIVADGARSSEKGERILVDEVRSIVSKVDWPCNVRLEFSEHNLGCKTRVSTGIDWVFSLVDEAVILEDDCLPTSAFFSYCRDMLSMYRNNPKVYSISGTSFLENSLPNGHYMSDYALMWGWATWRDRWIEYQVDPKDAYGTVFRKWWHRPVTLLYWILIFFNLTGGRIDTWDYQWILTVWRNHGLVVRPSVNLIKNIGFGENATHTTISDHFISTLVTWDGQDDLKSLQGGLRSQVSYDAIDEKIWAGIGWKAPIIMIYDMLRNRI